MSRLTLALSIKLLHAMQQSILSKELETMCKVRVKVIYKHVKKRRSVLTFREMICEPRDLSTDR